MNFADGLLTTVSTLASAALAFMTIYLSQKKNVHYFIVVGQIVFAWLSLPLIAIVISRIVVSLDLVQSDTMRYITGVVYCLAIMGIIWSALGHARPKSS